MTAKEMFEKLGWTQKVYEEVMYRPSEILYEYVVSETEKGYIIFSHCGRTVSVFRSSSPNEWTPTFVIRNDVRKAINKQCEELGW